MESLLFSYLTAWEPFVYPLIFLGVFFEGDLILFTAAFLIHQGILHPLPALMSVLWGTLLGVNLWYTLGLKFREAYPLLNKWAERLAAPLDEKLKNEPFQTIFIAKFTYGIRSAILFRAGALKIKWQKIEPVDILATLLWMIIISALGYLSSASLSYLKPYLRFGELALLLALLIFWGIEYFVRRKSGKKL